MASNAQKVENIQFQTEVSQLLHLVIHSLYSNKEIFLRELISNASDANDKLRFSALNNAGLYGEDSELRINIDINQEEKTITISDNGIGMTKEEVVDNLGTIAKSGTKEFLAKLTGDSVKDSNLIGQFGVGFYSAFIVADKVVVRTKKADSDQDATEWESSGEDNYNIKSISKENRGTDVILHLKKDEEEFLSDYRIRTIISKYSDHIAWPINMKKLSSPEDKDKNVVNTEYEVVNKAKAMWTLPKKDIEDKDYVEFYKHVSHDINDPAIWTHNRVEGKTEYISLLYIPKNAPFDIGNREQKHGLHLYVKRVFIMDNANQFLPNYLRFVKGLIDSNDLPLNISREILQSNAVVNTIKGALTKKSLSLIEKLSQDKEKYKLFWNEFGAILREGIVEDFANKDDIAKLLRFRTTESASEDELCSFADYLDRMQDKQEKIYYLTANSYSAAKSSPHLELFESKGIEVILFTDRIDEWVVGHLDNFDGKKLQSISHGELQDQLLEKDSEGENESTEDIKTEMEKIYKVLENKVKSVRESKRLTTSPACLVADEGEMSREMLKLLQASGQQIPNSLPIFEVNPKHPLIKRIINEKNAEQFNDWTNLVFEQAILAEGGVLEEPGHFVSRLNKLLLQMSA
ncbi:MAG: molecular chaperone HtpG [Legionellales bacterium]|nr:molecular chaperone HtpG [Legionellales bacterium]